MTLHSRQVLQYAWYQRKGETVLDLVRDQRKRLREYKPPVATAPELHYGMDTALSKLPKGTWQYASVSLAANLTKQDNERELKRYEQDKKCLEDPKGVQMKQDAINSAIDMLEEIEREALAKGGKTFEELHPDFKQPEYPERSPWRDPEKSYEFKAEFTFQLVSDLTEKRKAKYIEL